MFLRKAIKSFGLFVLVFCISISAQNEIITIKAANNGSEIRLEDTDIDAIQPSQIYTIKLNPNKKTRNIGELNIEIKNGLTDYNWETGKMDESKEISISFKTFGSIWSHNLTYDYHGYHYLASIWVNGINVTKENALTYGVSAYSYINGWGIIVPGKSLTLGFPRNANKTALLNTELKIQKIKCDETVTTEEPSCATDGTIKHTCKTCKYTYSEPIKATGHTYITKQANYPTVYNAGTMDLYCTKCGNESTSEIPQYEFNVSIGGSQLKAIRLGHNLLFADTHKEAKDIPFVVPHGESVFDKQHS